MRKIKPFLYVMPSVGKPYQVIDSGKIKKIVFSSEVLEGNINGQDIKLIGKQIGQHTIEFDNDNVTINLTMSSPTTVTTGYIIVYKEYEEKYQNSNLTDDLEEI